jgi:fibronectin type 3 domain-containing protein
MRTIVVLIMLGFCGVSELHTCGSHETRARVDAQPSAPTQDAKTVQAPVNAAASIPPASNSTGSVLVSTKSLSEPHTVKLSWNASVPASKSPRDAIAGYNVYRNEKPHVKCSAENRIASLGASATSYVDSHVKAGQTYYYVTTAIGVTKKESERSNEVKAVIR